MLLTKDVHVAPPPASPLLFVSPTPPSGVLAAERPDGGHSEAGRAGAGPGLRRAEDGEGAGQVLQKGAHQSVAAALGVRQGKTRQHLRRWTPRPREHVPVLRGRYDGMAAYFEQWRRAPLLRRYCYAARVEPGPLDVALSIPSPAALLLLFSKGSVRCINQHIFCRPPY